jgi:hypothetical protein
MQLFFKFDLKKAFDQSASDEENFKEFHSDITEK